MQVTDELLYQSAAKARDIWLSTLTPDDEIPEHQFSKRFERKMNRLIKQQRRPPQLNRTLRYLKRSLAAAMIALVVVFSGMMTVEAYRMKVMEIVSQVFHELTYYRFTSQISDDELPNINLSWLPDGMNQIEDHTYGRDRCMIYENDTGGYIEIWQSVILSGEAIHMISDTEDAVVEHIDINGADVIVNTKNGESTLIWSTNNIVYCIYSNIDLDEIIKIAEQIQDISS